MMIQRKHKNSLLSIVCLSSLLASCSNEYTYPDAKYEEGVVVSVDGKSISYEEIYKLFDGEKTSAQSYFNVAKSAIAQIVTSPTESMRATVQRKIDDLEETWRKNASDNSTSYKEEMEKGLESENVLTIDDLRAKYLASEQVSENKNNYEATKSNDKNELYAISEELTKRYVNEEVPYHVSHILVKVDASDSTTNSGLTSARITEDNAKKIGDVVKNLIRDTKFSDVAYTFSEDDGSANNYGELAGSSSGVSMNKSTSYINEFKLGVYAYDSFVNPQTKNQTRTGDNNSNVSIKEDLRIPSVVESSIVKDTISETKIAQGKVYGIPLSAVLSLRNVASQTKSDSGQNVIYNDNGDKITEASYPRNVLFNNYFNQHSVSFIYDDSDEYEDNFINTLKDAYEDDSLTLETIQTNYPDRYKEYSDIKQTLDIMDKEKFKTIDGVSNNLITLDTTTIDKATASTDTWKVTADTTNLDSKKILCASDTSGKNDPIIVVRGGSGDGDSGYQGIHFIVVNQSRFNPISNENYNNDVNNNYKYWRVNTPNESQTELAYTSDYDKYPSFINYVDANISAASSNNEYVSRTTWVKNAVTGFDSNEEISIYQYNKEQFNKRYNKDFDSLLGTNYATIINKYISVTLESAKTKSEETLDESWETYINNLISYQDIQPKRIVPTISIPLFQQGNLTSIKESLNESK